MPQIREKSADKRRQSESIYSIVLGFPDTCYYQKTRESANFHQTTIFNFVEVKHHAEITSLVAQYHSVGLPNMVNVS